METCQAPFIRKRCFRIAILVLSFLHVLKRIHKERKMKMLTTTFNVVKLYIYIYVCVSINIDIFKEENPNNFHLKYIHTFCYKDTKDGEGKKRKRNLSQFCNFAFSRRSDFIFQTKFFSHGEWSSTHAKSSFRRNWKKAEHTIIYFPPDSLVCIYGGGPLCLKSFQPSLLRSPR